MTYGLSNSHVTEHVTWPRRCCEAVWSAILATAWLLVAQISQELIKMLWQRAPCAELIRDLHFTGHGSGDILLAYKYTTTRQLSAVPTGRICRLSTELRRWTGLHCFTGAWGGVAVGEVSCIRDSECVLDTKNAQNLIVHCRKRSRTSCMNHLTVKT